MRYCELCGAELHSVVHRRLGFHDFCRDCGDLLVLPVFNSFLDKFVEHTLECKLNLNSEGGNEEKLIAHAKVLLNSLDEYGIFNEI